MSDRQDKEQDFLARISQRMEQAESELNANTLRDLRLARYTALAQLQKPRRLWQPVALATVTASVLALAVGLNVMQTTSSGTAPVMDDMQLLSASDDLELYENLEFYQWLEFEARSG